MSGSHIAPIAKRHHRNKIAGIYDIKYVIVIVKMFTQGIWRGKSIYINVVRTVPCIQQYAQQVGTRRTSAVPGYKYYWTVTGIDYVCQSQKHIVCSKKEVFGKRCLAAVRWCKVKVGIPFSGVCATYYA